MKQETDQKKLPAGLYVVATPIGNLGDITQRALEVLTKADAIACEDTRRTGLLLGHFGIKNCLISYHEYNKLRKTQEILSLLTESKAIALVSDAGTPGISDPGFYLIREAIERGFRVFPIPGASALLAALVVSGLPSDRFAFEGFLPKRAGRRQKRLQALTGESRTMIFCESALRVKKLLEDMRTLWGERKAVLCRELTKKFEEVIRGTFSEILEVIETRNLKGEIVVVVAGIGQRFETNYEKPNQGSR
ncbi:MAG: 16S rRNA (cytidine(1402)-2'-O)-methyltransferase [bacterium]